ncbi:hypothetical protein N7505_004134 [Penicillium chrysogenum]|uniref:NmrA-like domain-containing protein n=1 Tax=Penicillium chrysogenum TaxID=5076 RepID=A0ABQ8WSE2_PENCH|nr:hypothetical protein N7505_004134 [Penicillium chrysogenum]
MVKVAVAGGTGGVGRTIVEELLRQDKHNVIILSRKSTPLPGLPSVPVSAIDYDDIASVATFLREHSVDVVISTLSLFTEEVGKAQMNLIQAAIESSAVNRFIPSEFAFNYSHPGLLDFHAAAQMRIDAADLLRSSHVDFTRFVFGWMLDTWNPVRAKSHMPPMSWVLDFENRRARIPGDGKAPLTLLHSFDLAKFVAALLDEESRWPETSAFAGDRITFNEVVELAESIMGQKWEVTYEPVSRLEKKDVVVFEQPEGSYDFGERLRDVTAEFGLIVVKDMMDASVDGLRNMDFTNLLPYDIDSFLGETKATNN